MPGRLRTGSATTRRRFLTTLASASAAAITSPAFSLSPQRPLVTHGVQSGDVSLDSGMVWARADRPARMFIEAATTDSFKDICHASFADALPETDFTAKALVEDLPPGQDIFYRLRFQDLWSPQAVSEPVVGRFRTASIDRRSISFVWSGDTAGQGWGIDTSRGGMRTYRTMLHNRPDFFVHCGDSIYADCTCRHNKSCRTARPGEISSPRKRARSQRASTTIAATTNTTCLTRICGISTPRSPFLLSGTITKSWRTGGRAKHSNVAAMTRKAHCFSPRVDAARFMNSCRCGSAHQNRAASIEKSPTVRCSTCFCLICAVTAAPTNAPTSQYGPDAYLLGPVQLAWLKRELKRSTATWKVIASDTPLGTIAGHARDALAPLGRGIEIADLLSFMQHAGYSQHGLDHRRSALHCGALFRSEPRGLPGLRAILGIRFRSDPRRDLDIMRP